LQQIEGFSPAHLAHDDPIRSMTKGGPEQVPNRDRRRVRLLPPGLEAHDIRMLDVELRDVLHDHDALICGQERGQGIQDRGRRWKPDLAGAGAGVGLRLERRAPRTRGRGTGSFAPLTPVSTYSIPVQPRAST
jgi:hypothetical protein